MKLLEAAEELTGLYITRPLQQRRQVLLGLAGQPSGLECDEDALFVRAIQAEDPKRQLEILAGAEDKESPRWNKAQADALFALEQYETAANHYQKSPQTQEIFSRLEICSRELGDYKQAYEYACKQR